MKQDFICYDELAYLHGKPTSTAQLRTEHADFKVFELLPFAPSGDGEHLLLHIEKTGENTTFVARQLAKHFGVKDMQVTYAGLKDRHAVTQQWFGVHLPGKAIDDLSNLDIAGVKVLSYQRHNKKLKTGALIGNRFELTLREVSDIASIQHRFEQVTKTGVPNYFGEQRFGFNGGNLQKALSLFNGQKIKDKKKRSMYLSAARSYLFNQMLSERIVQNRFVTPMQGDVFMLAGSQSIFKATEQDTDLQARLDAHDIDMTASMWGKGELLTQHQAHQLEADIAAANPALADGLCTLGLKQERRRARLTMLNPKAEVIDERTIRLSFMLPAGSYATAILRELTHYTDMAEQAFQSQN
ncbi:tRNA pseudouridine(13) synthase TruD [Thalassotalea montiporae]